MSNLSVLFRPHTKKKKELFSSCGLGKRCYFLQYSNGFLLVRKDKDYVYPANDQEVSISPVAHLSDLSNGNKFVFCMVLVENIYPCSQIVGFRHLIFPSIVFVKYKTKTGA